MAIEVGPGIAVGPGITIGPGPSGMLALLSPAGQAAYTAASSGNWFEVSSTDYNAVYSGLSGMSKIGMSDTQTNEVGTSWSINYLVTAPQVNATVTSGSYIIGCKYRISSNGTARFYSSTTYKGTYTKVANDMTTTGTGLKYFLRKTPAAEGATTYIGIFGAGPSSLSGGTTSWTGSGYSTNFSSWTTWNGSIPIFQALSTTTQQW